MRIAIDAMGGDNAPKEILAGALEAIELLTEEKQSEFADEYLKKLKAEAKIVYPTSI